MRFGTPPADEQEAPELDDDQREARTEARGEEDDVHSAPAPAAGALASAKVSAASSGRRRA